jgi:hypothetical protein
LLLLLLLIPNIHLMMLRPMLLPDLPLLMPMLMLKMIHHFQMILRLLLLLPHR